MLLPPPLPPLPFLQFAISRFISVGTRPPLIGPNLRCRTESTCRVGIPNLPSREDDLLRAFPFRHDTTTRVPIPLLPPHPSLREPNKVLRRSRGYLSGKNPVTCLGSLSDEYSRTKETDGTRRHPQPFQSPRLIDAASSIRKAGKQHVGLDHLLAATAIGSSFMGVLGVL